MRGGRGGGDEEEEAEAGVDDAPLVAAVTTAAPASFFSAPVLPAEVVAVGCPILWLCVSEGGRGESDLMASSCFFFRFPSSGLVLGDARTKALAWHDPPSSPARHGLAASKPGGGAWVCVGMVKIKRQERGLAGVATIVISKHRSELKLFRCASGCHGAVAAVVLSGF